MFKMSMMKGFLALFAILVLLAPAYGQGFDSSNVDAAFDNLVEEETGPDGGADVGGGDEETDEGDDGRNSFGNFYGVTGPAPGDGAANAEGEGQGVSLAQDVQGLFSTDLGDDTDATYYDNIVQTVAEQYNPDGDNENPTIGSIYEEGVEEGTIERGQGNRNQASVFRGGSDQESVFTNNGQGGVGGGPGEGAGNGQFLSAAIDSVEDSEGFEDVAEEGAIDDALSGYR
eukprot:TRINITY_DN4541_c0_g1_i1.p2 TRINITY_DN4541_c0_g1~~TRINITY_DN4541_c0_g1_i1.p2  ORF type:complete len:229 (+),score=53.57 TRINITY_DN4541_c0_g1_i1:183-869(+)